MRILGTELFQKHAEKDSLRSKLLNVFELLLVLYRKYKVVNTRIF